MSISTSEFETLRTDWGWSLAQMRTEESEPEESEPVTQASFPTLSISPVVVVVDSAPSPPATLSFSPVIAVAQDISSQLIMPRYVRQLEKKKNDQQQRSLRLERDIRKHYTTRKWQLRLQCVSSTAIGFATCPSLVRRIIYSYLDRHDQASWQ